MADQSSTRRPSQRYIYITTHTTRFTIELTNMKSTVITLLTLTSTGLAGVVVLPSSEANNITATTTLDELFARNAADFTCTKGTDTPSPDMHLDKYGCKGITPQICADHASCKAVTVTDSVGKKCKRFGVSYSRWNGCKYVSSSSLPL
jgi:hypothetical protein